MVKHHHSEFPSSEHHHPSELKRQIGCNDETEFRQFNTLFKFFISHLVCVLFVSSQIPCHVLGSMIHNKSHKTKSTRRTSRRTKYGGVACNGAFLLIGETS